MARGGASSIPNRRRTGSAASPMAPQAAARTRRPSASVSSSPGAGSGGGRRAHCSAQAWTSGVEHASPRAAACQPATNSGCKASPPSQGESAEPGKNGDQSTGRRASPRPAPGGVRRRGRQRRRLGLGHQLDPRRELEGKLGLHETLQRIDVEPALRSMDDQHGHTTAVGRQTEESLGVHDARPATQGGHQIPLEPYRSLCPLPGGRRHEGSILKEIGGPRSRGSGQPGALQDEERLVATGGGHGDREALTGFVRFARLYAVPGQGQEDPVRLALGLPVRDRSRRRASYIDKDGERPRTHAPWLTRAAGAMRRGKESGRPTRRLS